MDDDNCHTMLRDESGEIHAGEANSRVASPGGSPGLEGDRNAVWSAVKLRLRQDLGETTVDDWIEPMALASRAEGVVTLSAPSHRLISRVRAEMGERLKTAWRGVDPSVTRLRYVVDPAGAAAPAPRLTTPEPRLSFERFVVGGPNRPAYVAARRLAETPAPSGRPLLIVGAGGEGKSHLLHAVANRRAEALPGEGLLFMGGAAMRDWAAQDDWARLDARIRALGAGGPILFDGLEAMREAPRRAMAERFVTRCLDKGRAVAATLRCEPGGTARIDWARRLLGPDLEIVRLPPADRALRSLLLARWAREAAPRLGVDEDALSVLAERLPVEPRRLLQAWRRLRRLADVQRRRVGRDFARVSLDRLGVEAAPAPALERVLETVAAHFGVEARALRSAERLPAQIRARRVAMYLAERMTGLDMAEIGAALGGRDGDLVRAARDWVRAARRGDGAFDQAVETLRLRLVG